MATDEQYNEIINGITSVVWLRVQSLHNIPSNADAVFILKEMGIMDYLTISKTIFINAVSITLKEINATENVVLINGWNGFLTRPN